DLVHFVVQDVAEDLHNRTCLLVQEGRRRHDLCPPTYLVPGRGKVDCVGEKLPRSAPLAGGAHDEPAWQVQITGHAACQLEEALVLDAAPDVLHVEEGVATGADVHECGLHPWQDVADAPLVDISGDTPAGGPLDEYFGEDVVFEQCDPGLGGGAVDQNLAAHGRRCELLVHEPSHPDIQHHSHAQHGAGKGGAAVAHEGQRHAGGG